VNAANLAADWASSPDSPYVVELGVFEGPLDLLLHLVRRHELDILDLPISFICEKYLEYLEFMRALDLEVAGEYLVMAATLAYLKSRELLPRPEMAPAEAGGEAVGVDPRDELVRRLLAYQTFRDAADRINQRPVSGRDVFVRGGDVGIEPQDAGLAPVTLFRLAEAFQRVLERARVRKSHEVILERVTLGQRMQQLALLLDGVTSVEFEGLFLGREWESEAELRAALVVTLVATLELVKMGLVRVHQPQAAEGIRIDRTEDWERLRASVDAYDDATTFGDRRRVAERRGPGEVDGAGDLDEARPAGEDAGSGPEEGP
jgi:segregation and condensation protein A